MALAQVAARAAEPDVLGALQSAAGRSDLPATVRNLLDVFVRIEQDQPLDNIMRDGSFETGNLDWRQGVVTDRRAYRGRHSLRLNLAPPFRAVQSAHGRNFPHQRVPSGTYFVSAMVLVETEHPDVESYVRFRASARDLDGRSAMHVDSAHVNVTPGEWNRMSVIADIGDRNSINLDIIVFHNYSRGDVAYMDDIVVVHLDR